MAKQKWPKEPWRNGEHGGQRAMFVGDGRRFGMLTKKEQKAAEDRATACVNALAGVSDPDAAIRAARDTMTSLRDFIKSLPADAMGRCTDFPYTAEAIGRLDAALALLGTEAE